MGIVRRHAGERRECCENGRFRRIECPDELYYRRLDRIPGFQLLSRTKRIVAPKVLLRTRGRVENVGQD